ncbi:UNVERIFIED_CONTAM: hypothetical protein HDU68_004818 [Siphonaria sp. JEL0065]|nr:hypothetical protein HDU68_004818 [Siphonaria sp. JEL0065]
MKLAILASVTATALAVCAPTQNSCQIQSDPWVSPFSGSIYSLDTTGTFSALDASDLKVQIVVVQADTVHGPAFVVDQVTYTCGSDVQTFSAGPDLGQHVLECNGSKVVLGKGYDPVPNVQIQQILYLGSDATGGLCFGDVGTTCPQATGTKAVDSETQTGYNGNGQNTATATSAKESYGQKESYVVAATSVYGAVGTLYSAGYVSNCGVAVAAIATLFL